MSPVDEDDIYKWEFYKWEMTFCLHIAYGCNE